MQSSNPALSSIRIVLVEPSHPGNIGATARAMKNMGLSNLVLVAPDNFPHDDAVARAAGADDVLEQARIVSSVAEAVADCVSVLGTSARDRGIPIPALSPREAAAEMIAQTEQGPVALLFGRERTGLTNDELARCRARVAIPANPEFASLNLGQAVQILSYEVRLASQQGQQAPLHKHNWEPAPHAELEGLFGHFAEALEQLDFHKGRNPDAALIKLRRLFLRGGLETREIRLLRGILAEAQYWVRAAKR